MQVEYPSWRRMNIHAISFHVSLDSYELDVVVPDVEVNYHLATLLSGKLSRIYVPQVQLRMKSLPERTSATTAASSALPPAALFTGEWLTHLPIDELRLEQLQVEGRTPNDEAFHLQSNVHLQAARLNLAGELQLPSPYNRLAFAMNAEAKAGVRLLIASDQTGSAPFLELQLDPLPASTEANNHSLPLTGHMTVNLTRLLPRLAVVFPQFAPLSGLQGEVRSQ